MKGPVNESGAVGRELRGSRGNLKASLEESLKVNLQARLTSDIAVKVVFNNTKVEKELLRGHSKQV